MSTLTLQILDLVNTGRISADDAARLIRAARVKRKTVPSPARLPVMDCCTDISPMAEPKEYNCCGILILR